MAAEDTEPPDKKVDKGDILDVFEKRPGLPADGADDSHVGKWELSSAEVAELVNQNLDGQQISRQAIHRRLERMDEVVKIKHGRTVTWRLASDSLTIASVDQGGSDGGGGGGAGLQMEAPGGGGDLGEIVEDAGSEEMDWGQPLVLQVESEGEEIKVEYSAEEADGFRRHAVDQGQTVEESVREIMSSSGARLEAKQTYTSSGFVSWLTEKCYKWGVKSVGFGAVALVLSLVARYGYPTTPETAHVALGAAQVAVSMAALGGALALGASIIRVKVLDTPVSDLIPWRGGENA